MKTKETKPVLESDKMMPPSLDNYPPITGKPRIGWVKHSEAPWKWDGIDLWHIGESYGSKVNPHEYLGIMMDSKLEQSGRMKANAQLIACAPELLATLSLFVDCVDGKYDELVEIAKPLLQRARGE